MEIIINIFGGGEIKINLKWLGRILFIYIKRIGIGKRYDQIVKERKEKGL